MKKITLSILAATVLGSTLYAEGTLESLYFIGDDLKTGIKYQNTRFDFTGNLGLYTEENYNKNKMSYIKPNNYRWKKEKQNGELVDKLEFPESNNYAYLERIDLVKDTNLAKSKYEKDEMFIALSGGSCVGVGCSRDEIITSVILPKKFKITGYEAQEKLNEEYQYNEKADFKLIDNTLTLYSKNVQGAYIKLWFKDISTTSNIYEDVSESLEKFSEISVSKTDTETTITMPMDNVFDSGKAVAKPMGKEWLKALVDALRDKNFKEIRVEGHTDNTPIKGTYPSNWELSTARASDAVRFMIANGIEADKIAAVGYADTRPIADNNSKENKAKNRRIEITIVGNPDNNPENAETSPTEPTQPETKSEPSSTMPKNAKDANECDALGGKWQWNGAINDMQCL
ncbi:MAG: OmpA/MotB family protein [Campylobacterota bacterium]